MSQAKNVLGGILRSCSHEPLTGFYRDGCCNTSEEDLGQHTICVETTESFLEFSRLRGNDLVTPAPWFNFPGLKAGDRWCLCASRWKEALDAGVAPPVVLEATHERATEVVSLDDLFRYAVAPRA